MDIAALSTAMSALCIQQELADRMNGVVKAQFEVQGEQIRQLIDGAAAAPVPSGSFGQNIDIRI